LGNSDHNIITVDCRMSATNYNETPKFNLSKGDFCGLQDSLKLNWNDILLPHQNNIDDMWNVFRNVDYCYQMLNSLYLRTVILMSGKRRLGVILLLKIYVIKIGCGQGT